ncbi:MAG: hypothetical protein QM820_24375 [Minicystis sp.]
MLRRDTRRRLDQFIANPNCRANVLSAVHDIPMLDVAKDVGLDPEFGQSPFAIGRGLVFERSLYAEGAERLLAALVAAGVLSASAAGFVDLRTRKNGGPISNMDVARALFEGMLQRFAAASDADRPALPAILAAPALQIPGRAILPDGMFAVDVVTVHPAPRPQKVVLRVGEIKVYPDRGGHTDAHQLATTRAQAGIYVHALRLAVEAAGVGREVEVDDHGFLVLTRPGSNAPSVRAHEDLRFQAKRAERAFERLREAAALAEALPADSEGAAIPKARLAVVRDAPKAYEEGCVSFCELERHCHAEALRDDSPAVLGRDVARFLGTISLSRAAALLDGAAAANAAEEDFVRRVAEARKTVAA